MKNALSRLVAASLLVACGGIDKPSIELDVGDAQGIAELVDGGTELCTPDCDGKNCGPDGCNGTCGACKFQIEFCSDEGVCEAAECESSKDCPGQLVCSGDLGECVVCVGDEDCSEDKSCGADHECHSTYECSSDKDCKEYGMICDKEAGICVECLALVGCPDGQFCLDSFCVDSVCTPGESYCDGMDVRTCNEEGSAEEVTKTCSESQYCEDGQCHAQICPPGKLYCEEDMLQTCDPIGKEVIESTDCSENEEVCYQGECVEQDCVPDSTWCIDDSTAAVCAADGMTSIVAPCSSEYYCAEGSCYPWVCEPGISLCEDNIAKECNGKGSAVANEIACGDSFCVGGACKPIICDSNTSSCDGNKVMQCDATGTVLQEKALCGAGQYCHEQGLNAQCKNQICEPGQKGCDGSKAMLCNGFGSVESLVKDCKDDGQGCKDGECVDQICTPNATYCDGNVVKECSGDGASSSVVETCGQNQYCGEDGNAAACADQICTPDATACQGSKILQCDAVGAELDEVKDCLDEGMGCLGGECAGNVCGNGVIDPGEDCDDGNQEDDDGCDVGCKVTLIPPPPCTADILHATGAKFVYFEATEVPSILETASQLLLVEAPIGKGFWLDNVGPPPNAGPSPWSYIVDFGCTQSVWMFRALFPAGYDSFVDWSLFYTTDPEPSVTSEWTLIGTYNNPKFNASVSQGFANTPDGTTGVKVYVSSSSRGTGAIANPDLGAIQFNNVAQ
jgi:hypothetical protein